MTSLLLSLLIAGESILFVGNSYTMGNGGVWAHVKEIYESVSADTVHVGNHTMGGATYQNHWNNQNLLESIATGGWDMAVFQEQSCMPVINPMATYTYGDSLALYCLSNGVQPVFFMTWARKADPLMLQGLSAGYSRMGFHHQSPVTPCGTAFELLRQSNPEIDPYAGDGAHPSVEGSYLAACVIAAVTLDVDLSQPGIWQPAEVAAGDGVILRETAVEACSLYSQPMSTR